MLIHRFFISLSATFLLILFGLEKTHAAVLEDAFGKTFYGFKCSNRIYKKDDIFAAAKRFCDAMRVRPAVKNEQSYEKNGFRQPWGMLYDQGLLNLDKSPHYMQPILEDGSLFPTELPSVERVPKNHLGLQAFVDPGPDRIIINKNCDIITAISDYEYMLNDFEGRIERCTVIKSHKDIFPKVLGK